MRYIWQCRHQNQALCTSSRTRRIRTPHRKNSSLSLGSPDTVRTVPCWSRPAYHLLRRTHTHACMSYCWFHPPPHSLLGRLELRHQEPSRSWNSYHTVKCSSKFSCLPPRIDNRMDTTQALEVAVRASYLCTQCSAFFLSPWKCRTSDMCRYKRGMAQPECLKRPLAHNH